MATRWGTELLIELYRSYAPDLARCLERVEPLASRIGKSYANEERRVLYLMTRHAAPDLIIEVSPKRGWSTVHMAVALEHNGTGRVLSFELDPIYAAITRRTLKEVGLAHRVDVVTGDVREELPRIYEGLRHRGGIEFLFIDAEHSEPFARWYLANLFPLVREGGVIHVHDIEAAPERVVGGERILPAPTGEEHVLAHYLCGRRERYEWFSLAEAIRDPAYLAAVSPSGGGDVSLGAGGWVPDPAERIHGLKRNPTLWIRAVSAPETDHYPQAPFDPISRTLRDRVALTVRRAIAPWYAPLRERRRLRKLRAVRRDS